MWEEEPIPADAKVKVPGFALAAATRSAAVLKPLLAEATSKFGDVPIKTTGTKSRTGSYGSVLCSMLSVAIEDELVTSI
jgi:hypothetical protein